MVQNAICVLFILAEETTSVMEKNFVHIIGFWIEKMMQEKRWGYFAIVAANTEITLFHIFNHLKHGISDFARDLP